MNYLPRYKELKVNVLSNVFSKTTSSYKYLFFMSLLELIRDNGFDIKKAISFNDIAKNMLVNAWYPHTFFRLSFGKQDQIGQVLDGLNIQSKAHNKDSLLKEFEKNHIGYQLLRYVPYRFLRPFFIQLRGIPDSKLNIDREIFLLATEKFEEVKPLYRFVESRDALFIHPEWMEYIRVNYTILEGWVAWNWLGYMQRKNPNVPALAKKLFPVIRREPLTAQTKYWRTVSQYIQIRCIYSDEIVTKINLDHYLPWSFIVHNHLWNLVPVTKEANSQKSNLLPSSIYFDKFVELQYQGLVVTHKNLPFSKWQKYVEPYIVDLRLKDDSDLLNYKRINKAYSEVMEPLRTLAAGQGFLDGWVYRYS
ncbi:hypothetical protein F9B85_00655 [Heliorestis acidaminivorans]|uniref:HNH nuclease domain-containing protein n=1 Tax=Heliorestis acidaminivorans TaxID=553427 RepID=A0A6I0F3C4_9FIRM|nr:HNH endonuclease domain-containing protein [Heliorestis acidaminivorans]KAB2954240.1 hypothetical protein F9B85_00655 [Heliorestis acidaminivorans]